jgi:hypothetical protein
MFLPPEEEQIGLVQGRMPDSKEEWWAAQALWKYEVPFMFQFEIFSGKTRRGGLVVDFVVWNPMFTPFLVHGDYWHRRELRGGDKRNLIAIADYFKVGIENIPILWESDAQTKEDVFAFVRTNIAN